jgi:ABC-type nickel/cobalt efflux system permease component RcnA
MRIDPNSKVGRFLGHVLPGVIRPLHILWHEIIGFVFLVFAAWPVPSVIRYWRKFNQSGDKLAELLVSAAAVLIMAYFGITSFLRARKISRS